MEQNRESTSIPTQTQTTSDLGQRNQKHINTENIDF